jgi:hypothetical protein
MAYADIADMTRSGSLAGRMAAAAAAEDVLLEPADPESWVAENRWQLCAAPGWDDAWASAQASGNADPGLDPAVITDGQILSQVQAVLAG